MVQSKTNSPEADENADSLAEDKIRNNLLQRIKREFAVNKESISLGETSLEYYCVADPDSLLDEKTLLDAHGELKWQPYWAQNWDAAHGVSIELSRRELSGMRVLDLGCGLGVTGAVAASQGAMVVMGDNAPPALLFAELNCLPWRDSTDVRLLDWQTDHLGMTFEMIVGSDILYDRDEVKHLDRFWRNHLKPGGTILLGDPNRPMTREYFEMLEKLGWRFVEEFEHRTVHSKSIRVVELTLGSAN